MVPYLKQLYFKVKDTSELQDVILNTLLDQKSKESFSAFKDLITQEPPISDENYGYRDFVPPVVRRGSEFSISYGDVDKSDMYYGASSMIRFH